MEGGVNSQGCRGRISDAEEAPQEVRMGALVWLPPPAIKIFSCTS